METEILEVIWSEIAVNDLEAIYFYLAQDSVFAANTIIDHLFSKTRQLEIKGFARSGQIDDINPNYRRLIEGNYKILYVIDDNRIIIHGIFDCRLNPKKLKKRSSLKK